MKNFINTFAMYWDSYGNQAFTNIGWSAQSNEKQNKAIKSLMEKVIKLVRKETEKINNLS